MAPPLLTAAVMKHYKKLLENNAVWAKTMVEQDAEFFAKREQAQAPHYLIVGCSDSRVPLEVLTQALPGEMFVHRNIGNQVWANDLNAQSVVQFAVGVLEVEHVIVCGHSNCGALKAASASTSHGMLDYWLSDIRDTIHWNKERLDAHQKPEERLHELSRLNVLQQVRHLTRAPVVQSAWERGRRPILSGWIYNIGTGLIERVVEGIDGNDKTAPLWRS